MSTHPRSGKTVNTPPRTAIAATLLAGLLLTACATNPTTTARSLPTPPAAPPATVAPAAPTAAGGITTTTVAPAAPTAAGGITTTTAAPAAPTAAGGITTATVAPAAPTATPLSGCAPTGTGVPAGATSKQVIDVDGDGRPDTGWLSGGTTFGITTASGATFSIPIELAGGGPRTVLVANTDGHGTIAALASDGRTVELLLVHNCGLFPATNAQGAHYEFDLGLRGTGTGVGCSQITGTPTRSLVGLNVHLNAAGLPDSIHRTQIILGATTARNGATDTIPAQGNPAATQSGSTISCGDLTLNRDGITERN